MTEDKVAEYKVHDSIRGIFAYELFKAMAINEDIWLILPDLGFGMFDRHVDYFGERVQRIGASEQLALGLAIGLAETGKIPFVYSITSFLIYRPFEWIRNYLHHEHCPVRLVGSGYQQDYAHDGFTHQPSDLDQLFSNHFPHIHTYWPATKFEVPECVKSMIAEDGPSFICLRR